ncbi:Pentatricopeptide repeat-containing protein 1 [Mactra antiquata]
MYKFILESLCTGKYSKLAANVSKKLNSTNTSYCVRRYSKKQRSKVSASVDQLNEEVPHSSYTRFRNVKPPLVSSLEESRLEFDGVTAQSYNDGEYNRIEPTDWSFNNFHEISDGKQNKRDASRKSRKKLKLPSNWADEFGTMAKLEEYEEYDEDVQDDGKEEEIFKHIRLARYNRPHIPNWYSRRIQKLGKQGEVRKAIEVFDDWMIKRDRVKPTHFEYTVLMKLLGDVGYTEKAFKLYRDMLRRRITADDHVYTCLFNACANSPWPEDGLKYARSLRRAMLYKDRVPSHITYLSMIKAFGFCGDITTAFAIADEAAMYRIDHCILSNLLCACISDKESGFRHAILVWRKFQTLGIKPKLGAYNLLLRCVDECGIGDLASMTSLFGQTNRYVENNLNKGDNTNFIEEDKFHVEGDIKTNHVETLDDGMDKRQVEGLAKDGKKLNYKKLMKKSFKELDELMDRYGFLDKNEKSDTGHDADNLLQDGELKTANLELTVEIEKKTDQESNADLESQDDIDFSGKEWWQQDIFENLATTSSLTEHVEDTKLLTTEFLNTLPDILDPNNDVKLSIDVKKLRDKHYRLDLLGGMNGILQTLNTKGIKPDLATFTLLARSIRLEDLDLLINKMWSVGVKPDIIFYNHCIQENADKNPDIAWALFDRLKEEGLVPNVRTYSILAMACQKFENGKSLLQQMQDSDIVPNTYTFCHLLYSSGLDFNYKKYVLVTMDKLEVKCNRQVIERIEHNLQHLRRRIHEQERNHANRQVVTKKELQTLEYERKKLHTFEKFYNDWLERRNIVEDPHPWQSFKPIVTDE